MRQLATLFLELQVLFDDRLPIDGVLEEGPLALRGGRVRPAEPGAGRRGGFELRAKLIYNVQILIHNCDNLCLVYQCQ